MCGARRAGAHRACRGRWARPWAAPRPASCWTSLDTLTSLRRQRLAPCHEPAPRRLPARRVDVGLRARGQLRRTRHRPPRASVRAADRRSRRRGGLRPGAPVRGHRALRGRSSSDGGPVDAVPRPRVRECSGREPVGCALIVLVTVAVGIRRDAVRPPPGARGQLLRRRRPGRGRVRGPGHGVRHPARVHRVPGVHQLRPSRRCRDRGADRRPAGRDRAVHAVRRGAAELTGELVCYARSVAGPSGSAGGRHAQARGSTLGGPSCSARSQHVDPQPPASRRPTTSGSTDRRPRGGPQGPDPRRRRRDPVAAVDRPVLHRRIIFAYMLFFADSGERRWPRPC